MYMQPGSTPINMKHLTNIILREKKKEVASILNIDHLQTHL